MQAESEIVSLRVISFTADTSQKVSQKVSSDPQSYVLLAMLNSGTTLSLSVPDMKLCGKLVGKSKTKKGSGPSKRISIQRLLDLGALGRDERVRICRISKCILETCGFVVSVVSCNAVSRSLM
jgi:hypothetical protein